MENPSNAEELIVTCPCPNKEECFSSSTGYKLCFTCGQHNVNLDDENFAALPNIYKDSVFKTDDGEVWTPYFAMSETKIIFLDIKEDGGKMWSICPIINDTVLMQQGRTYEYFNFYNAYTDFASDLIPLK